jgi:hypothetical protein
LKSDSLESSLARKGERAMRSAHMSLREGDPDSEREREAAHHSAERSGVIPPTDYPRARSRPSANHAQGPIGGSRVAGTNPARTGRRWQLVGGLRGAARRVSAGCRNRVCRLRDYSALRASPLRGRPSGVISARCVDIRPTRIELSQTRSPSTLRAFDVAKRRRRTHLSIVGGSNPCNARWSDAG